jgi:hypothetical protein
MPVVAKHRRHIINVLTLENFPVISIGAALCLSRARQMPPVMARRNSPGSWSRRYILSMAYESASCNYEEGNNGKTVEA